MGKGLSSCRLAYSFRKYQYLHTVVLLCVLQRVTTLILSVLQTTKHLQSNLNESFNNCMHIYCNQTRICRPSL